MTMNEDRLNEIEADEVEALADEFAAAVVHNKPAMPELEALFAYVESIVADREKAAARRALETAQKALAGEDTVEWARGAQSSHIAYATAIGVLDDLIDDIEDRADRVDAEDGGRR